MQFIVLLVLVFVLFFLFFVFFLNKNALWYLFMSDFGCCYYFCFSSSLKSTQNRIRNENIISDAPSVFCRFNTFQLELSPSCYKDSVAVYDGSDTHAPLLGKFCGSELPPNMKSSSNQLFLVFNTDFSGSDRGWKASFRETLGKDIIRLRPPTVCW